MVTTELNKQDLLNELKKLELLVKKDKLDKNLAYILFTFFHSNYVDKIKKVICEVDKDNKWFLLPIKKDKFSLSLHLFELFSYLNKYKNMDFLTSLYNKRFFEETFVREIQDARKFKIPLSLLIFDIDNFKSVNDTYGHQVGDIVLKGVAQIIKNQIRGNDFACRIGGEEFAVIFRGTSIRHIYGIAERILKEVEKFRFKVEKFDIKITISAGGVVYSGYGKVESSKLFEIADANLYKAKRNGKNRFYISFYSEEEKDSATLVNEAEKNILFKS
ncbi:GGDEF domain-containing protein [Desulfonauticus submarinus]|uniref:diguanylate cyclase n=1 Tax=Desulfonauticus submarinus TaxID=206665 RepID=A0A1H0A795_9BACT|nr:GGDEF domain-containing protein [Desulfonauticus submarinus]SDN29420.1 diguanylate cyclase (GGDEF) domain-containing protein [Desulfonauticus submarinus]